MTTEKGLEQISRLGEELGYGVVIKRLRIDWAKALCRDGLGIYEAVRMTGIFPEDVEFYADEVRRSMEPVEPGEPLIVPDQIPPPVSERSYPEIPRTL